MASTPTNESGPRYHTKRFKGKGLGLVAARDLPSGTRIISESPILRTDRNQWGKNIDSLNEAIAKKVDEFNKAEQKAFFSLHNNVPHNEKFKYYNICKTNALPLEPGSGNYGVFIKASRMNHSCRPNCHNSWDPNQDKLHIHVMTDVKQGDELTLTYLKGFQPSAERKEILQSKFHFKCTCGLCSLKQADLEKMDGSLSQLSKLEKTVDSEFDDCKTPSKASDNLWRLCKMVKLCIAEQILGFHFYRLTLRASELVYIHGDAARARAFAKRAHDIALTCEGWNSVSAAKAMEVMRDPARVWPPSLTSEWETGRYHIPLGLTRTQYEDWLWRAESFLVPSIADRHALVANLRSTEYFPSYQQLPKEGHSDPAFYGSDNAVSPSSKHWCLLAQIEGVQDTAERVNIEVKDRFGNRCLVALFYDHSLYPENLTPGKVLVPGETLAVLYAQIHETKIIYVDSSYRFKVSTSRTHGP